MAGIDANTLLMLHLNDNVTDSAQYNLTVTNSNVTFSNSSPEFAGTYYGVFNGSSYLQIPNESYFNFGTTNFTLEGWFYFSGTIGVETFFCNYDSSITNGFSFFTISSTSMYFQAYNAGTVIANTGSQNPSLSSNTWYHIAFVKNGTTGTIYINGTSIGTCTFSAGIGSNSSPLYVSKYGEVTGDYFTGNSQEIRISNVARWTSNFTPPTSPYSSHSPSSGMFGLIGR